jgi:hypothetical protein
VSHVWIGLRLLESLKHMALHDVQSVGPAKDDMREVLLRSLGHLADSGRRAGDPSTHRHGICPRLDDNG